jgi:prevent-host-death family protein
MADLERATRTVNSAQAQQCFDDLVDEVNKKPTRVVVERDGKVVAALISAADLEYLEHMDRQRAEHFKVIQEIWARNADKDPEEVERDIAEAIAEMRAEERAKRAATTRT